MDLTGILSISGYGGLFKLVKQTKTGFVVESLTDGKRMQAFASSKISTLADIAVYTEDDEIPLKEILQIIFEKKDGNKLSLSSKSSSDDLKNFMQEVLPNYDKNRVYISDIKKLASWYNTLLNKGLIDLQKEEETSEENEVKEETPIEEKESTKNESKEKKDK